LQFRGDGCQILQSDSREAKGHDRMKRPKNQKCIGQRDVNHQPAVQEAVEAALVSQLTSFIH
jgi:hypothetical protein